MKELFDIRKMNRFVSYSVGVIIASILYGLSSIWLPLWLSLIIWAIFSIVFGEVIYRKVLRTK